jgi:RNA polymerase sigma factor for flagellar operon FliA
VSEGHSHLVEEHLGLIKSIALGVSRQLGRRDQIDDLVAWGSAGLLEAAERYDSRMGVKLTTYAYARIRGAMYDGLRQMARLPRKEWEKIEAAQRAAEYLENLAERERGARAEGAPVTPTPEEDLRALHEALQGVAVSYMGSIEAAAARGIELADERLVPADEQLASGENEESVREALESLPEKERHFLVKHYFEGKSLLQAGEELGLSKSWASRLHARAIDRLKKRLLAKERGTRPRPP